MTKISVTTSPVSTSRKLWLATALLAGGYGAAFLLGGMSELLPPAANSPAGAGADAGWFASLQGLVQRPERSTSSGSLIPQTKSNTGTIASALTPAPHVAEQPTWLVATPPADSLKIASRPPYAAAPTLGENQSVEEVGGPRVAESAPNAPKARITNVTAVTAQTGSRAASPWDRWPRWNESDNAAVNQPVAATFQDTSAASPRAIQTAFGDAEVVRKNSPLADNGRRPERSGRTHIVVDGDSLARLAECYLDDAASGMEIYRLNRDVLDNPELLPIGVELRIPDDRMADSNAGLPSARSHAASERSVPQGMVPVDWAPRALADLPRAELLRPVPAGQSD